jgi:glycosyltransferase involved in cell wall biosynthesis
MRVALLSYTNQASGVGIIAHGLLRWLKADSFLSVEGVKKGQDMWLERQHNVVCPDRQNLGRFIDEFKPDIFIAVETTFNEKAVSAVCSERRVRVATIVMQESYVPYRTVPDLFICPVRCCYGKVREPNKAYFDLPIEIESFKFVPKTQAKKFLHVMGYGAVGAAYNRRQTHEVVAGFLAANLPGATLTVHCQPPTQREFGEVKDPRVLYRSVAMRTPAEVYDGFDVLVQPDSYAGFNLPLLEAQACGMPVITVEGPPMNETVRDPAALIRPVRVEGVGTRHNPTSPVRSHQLNMTRFLVSPQGVADAIRRIAACDIVAKSARAREYAEAHAWTEARAEELRGLLGSLM